MPLRGSAGTPPTRTIDLCELLLDVGDVLDLDSFDAFLFGSRRHQTGSVRSDVDIALFTDIRITADQAQRIWEIEPYLDIFYGEDRVIRSVVNESRLARPSRAELLAVLDAVPLFLDGTWQTDADGHRLQVVLADRNPAATVVELYDLSATPPAARADILVVTALPTEFCAVVETLDPSAATDHGVARFDIEDRRGSMWRIELALADSMGSVAAALTTQDALRRTKAAHTVLLGIAAGVPGKVQLGDVVIPEQVLYYESQKLTDSLVEPAPSWRATDAGVRVAASVKPHLRGLTGIRASVRIHTDAVIASGEKVVASEAFRREVCSAHRKTTALDMESYGVARAAEKRGSRLSIIKSICDFADSQKNDDHQEFAATAAAAAFRQLVTEGAFRPVRDD